MGRRRGFALSLVLAVGAATSVGTAYPQSSAHFSLRRIVENNGSGFRVGQSYQLTGDTISPQPVELSTSESFTLHGRPLVTNDTDKPFCGLYIDGNAAGTNTEAVVLSLVCGHPSSCTEVQLSNNGVGWSGPFAYTLSRPWALVSNDGTRSVFARYKNGLGVWSGVCSDSIVLDRTAPTVTFSPVGGTFMSTQSVAITASEPATIRYTVDGSDPKTSPTAILYAGPVTVAANLTLRAYAVDPAGNTGAVVDQSYEICTGGNLSISGTVKDATIDAPMPLVRVTLNTGQYADTDTNGAYGFGNLPRGLYSIVSVTTPVAGYVTFQSEIKLCQASVTKDILLTRDATVFGTDTNSGQSADGVNTSTGNFALKVVDLSIPGRGPSVVFQRAYNSQDPVAGPLGYGWTWSYNTSHSTGPRGELVVRWGDGKIEVWAPDGSGGFTPMYGVFSTLVRNADTTFTLRRKDRIEYRFNTAGRLAQLADEYGNTITLSYSGSRLTTVTDTAGRVISLSHDANDRITNIYDPIGRSVSFAYDGNGNLASATDLAGKTTTYTYDANHQMRTVTDPKGNIVFSMLYDTSRRVVTSQRDALGGETRYVYDPPSRTTTIIDAMGNTSYHHFDELLRLVREDDPRGFFATYVFNARGNMESVTDKRGNVTSFTYDDAGNVLTKTEPLGRVTTAVYDAASNPLVKTDARGFSEVFEYDPVNGNLVTVYHCGAVVAATCANDLTVTKTTYAYDLIAGKLASVTEAAGIPALERTTMYQYDVMGNQVAAIDAMGNTSAFTYDGVGRKLTESHPMSRATAYEYDAMDRLISVTDALGGQAVFSYDANGNKTEHIDAKGGRSTFVYDQKDRLVSATDPLGRTESYAYDALDRRTVITNPRGASSTAIYDSSGNVLQEINAVGSVVAHEYDGNGNRTATTDAKGHRTTFEYDPLNRLVATRDPLGNTETFEYDANGNRTKVTNAEGEAALSSYDPFNRLASVADGVGNTTTNTHDALGRLVGTQDARGHRTSFTYDALDRLIEVTDSAGGAASSSYDALGNRTSIIDPTGRTTIFTYDALNRLVSETDATGQSTVNVYDPVGNLLSLANADGTTTFRYDGANQLVELTYPSAATVAYEYDLAGNRTRVIDAAGSTESTFDALNQLTSVTDPFGLTVGYAYDPNGNRTATRYPGNRAVWNYFDQLDRLILVEDWSGVRTAFTYDGAQRLTQQVMGNGAVVTYAYDAAGRLVTKEDRSAAGEVIASYSYTLDESGNRTGAAVVQPLAVDVPAVNEVFSHGDRGEVLGSAAASYSYDRKGNRATRSRGGVTTQYSYDFNNRLTSARQGAERWEYRYTSDGKRLSSTVGGIETRYLLDVAGGMEFVLAELTASNAATVLYVYGDGLLYSVDAVTGERRFYHFDPLGSTIAISNTQGEVIARYSYSPFGEPAGEDALNVTTPFTFVGKVGVMRESNGLYFMRARFFDPETRRFLSVDPEQGSPEASQSLNPYAYVQNNPMLAVDPTGQVKWGLLAIGVGEVVLGVAGVALMGTGVGAGIGATLAMAGGIQGVADIADAIRERPRTVVNPIEVVAGIGAALVFKTEKAVQVTQDLTGLATSAYGSGSGGLRMISEAHRSGKAWSWARGAWELSDVAMEGVSQEYDRYQSGRTPGPKGAVTATGSHAPTVAVGPSSPASGAPRGYALATQKEGSPAAAKGGGGGGGVVTRRPRKVLGMRGPATTQFSKDFNKLLNPGLLDLQTRSFVEQAIDSEIARLASYRITYRWGNEDSERRAKERRRQVIAQSSANLYSQLFSALTKHDAIVRDMSELPRFTASGGRQGGVYGSN